MDLLVVEKSVFNTCILISVDDELLRVSISLTKPLPSLALYADWAKLTVKSAQITKELHCKMHKS